jgi:hypothetical protein
MQIVVIVQASILSKSLIVFAVVLVLHAQSRPAVVPNCLAKCLSKLTPNHLNKIPLVVISMLEQEKVWKQM